MQDDSFTFLNFTSNYFMNELNNWFYLHFCWGESLYILHHWSYLENDW